MKLKVLLGNISFTPSLLPVFISLSLNMINVLYLEATLFYPVTSCSIFGGVRRLVYTIFTGSIKLANIYKEENL